MFLKDWSDFHVRAVLGRTDGRVLWQPRISCWVEDRLASEGRLPPPYTGMDYPELYRSLGCSARIYEYNECFKAVEDPAVRMTERKLNDVDMEVTTSTPAGKQVEIRRIIPGRKDGAWLRVKQPVTGKEELKVALWRAERTRWQWDQELYEKLNIKWQGLGAPTMFMPRTSVQDLFINQMGVENAIYALYDWPDTISAYFKVLEECHNRLIDIIIDSPVQIINFGDNVHSATLSPDLFLKYVMPVYNRRCERLHAAGKFVHAHWDGNVKTLLPFARETGLDGIEAITPEPQGDVSLEEIKEALGDKLFLIDGIPAVFFDVIFPESQLEDCVRSLLEMFAPKIILGISDEISSTGDIERIRFVGQIIDEYNARVEQQNKSGGNFP